MKTCSVGDVQVLLFWLLHVANRGTKAKSKNPMHQNFSPRAFKMQEIAG